MQRSSETIGTIAAALAKAQAQLVNPEKSLVGTILPEQAGGAERLFRYAPLASGLEIVRKTLSRHRLGSSDSARFWLMPPANGSPRIGLSALSVKRPHRIAWARH